MGCATCLEALLLPVARPVSSPQQQTQMPLKSHLPTHLGWPRRASLVEAQGGVPTGTTLLCQEHHKSPNRQNPSLASAFSALCDWF